MKKVKLLLMIFAALLVAQVSNAQASNAHIHHTEFIDVEGFIYCFDEPMIGQLHYKNVFHYDKSGNVTKMFLLNKDSWFVGLETGAKYKVIDVGKTTPDYIWPFPIPEDGVEFTMVNNMKIISKGNGKVWEGRAQIKLVFDKDGEVVAKKYINTTCF